MTGLMGKWERRVDVVEDNKETGVRGRQWEVVVVVVGKKEAGEREVMWEWAILEGRMGPQCKHPGRYIERV